jgi:SAM-dependent methyltransferase
MPPISKFADESFDLVTLFECLCIMTDSGTRMRMASEALRVLKPGGAFLFYDFRYRRPGLGDVLRPLRSMRLSNCSPDAIFVSAASILSLRSRASWLA